MARLFTICSILFALLPGVLCNEDLHEIHVETPSDNHRALLNQLTEENGDLDHLDHHAKQSTTIAGSKQELEELADKLKSHGIGHRIRRSASFLFENDSPDDGIFGPNDDISSFDTTKYHSYEEQKNFVRAAAEQYPDQVQSMVIGQSYQGEDIVALKIVTDPRKSLVVVDAGIHAREWIAPATALYVIKEMLTNPSNPDVVSMLRDANWLFVPNVNPDGYAYTREYKRYWRKNRSGQYCYWKNIRCCGTDLNRNFPFQWGVSGSSRNVCQDLYQGETPASETETRAITKLLLDEKPKLYLTLHSFGQMILIPFGYAIGAKPKNYNDLKRVAVAAANAMTLTNGVTYEASDSASLYPAGGGSDDWSIGMGNVSYAYTLELRPNPVSSRLVHFDPPTRVLLPTGRETLRGMMTMVKEIRCVEEGRCD